MTVSSFIEREAYKNHPQTPSLTPIEAFEHIYSGEIPPIDYSLKCTYLKMTQKYFCSLETEISQTEGCR